VQTNCLARTGEVLLEFNNQNHDWRFTMESLENKYQPLDFNQMIGHEKHKHTLTKMNSEGYFPQSILFVGPPGVGKTSAATIMARSANCQNIVDGAPCLACKNCTEKNFAYIENFIPSDLKTLSISQLEDLCSAPVYYKYRVVIFNNIELLAPTHISGMQKLLENNFRHTRFILLSNHLNKIDPSIISRSHVFEFNPINPHKISKWLLTIAKKEGIKLTESEAFRIADISDGSPRNAIKKLEVHAFSSRNGC